MIKGIIDRFEGEFALIETDEGMVQISRDKLPADLKEGDCVFIDGDHITVDHDAATVGRKAELQQRLKSLFSK